MTDDDATLLDRFVKNSDRAAFNELCARYIDLVYAAALRQTRNDAAMAADVTQAVFLVFSRRASTVHASALSGWFHRVTIYAVKNARRAERRRLKHERAAASQRPEAAAMNDDIDALMPLLDRAIASLSKRDQAAIIDRYLRGLSAGEVAAANGLTVAAAQKRMQRAIVKLRNYFRRHAGSGAANTETAAMAVTTTVLTAAHSQATAAPPTLLNTVIATRIPPESVNVLARRVMLNLTGRAIAARAAVCSAILVVGGVGLAGGIEVSHLGDPTPAHALGPPTQVIGAPTMPGRSLVASLSDGVSVELFAIGESPSSGRPWWLPSGVLTPAPYATCSGSISDDDATHVRREVAFRVTIPSGATYLFDASNSAIFAGGSVLDANGHTIHGLSGMAISVPDRPAVVRFTIAAGPWRTVDSVGPQGGAAHWLPSSRGMNVQKPVDGPDDYPAPRTTVTVTTFGRRTTPPNQEARLVAVDSAGGEWSGYIHDSNSSLLGWTDNYLFAGISAAQVRSVRLQLRPYDRWVEFRNISLHAGQMTRPTVLIHYDDLRVPPSTSP